MVCFQTKNPNLGKLWRVLRWKMLVYFMDTWSILQSFVIFYGHLVYVVRGNLVYFARYGILYQEKSGNSGAHQTFPTFFSICVTQFPLDSALWQKLDELTFFVLSNRLLLDKCTQKDRASPINTIELVTLGWQTVHWSLHLSIFADSYLSTGPKWTRNLHRIYKQSSLCWIGFDRPYSVVRSRQIETVEGKRSDHGKSASHRVIGIIQTSTWQLWIARTSFVIVFRNFNGLLLKVSHYLGGTIG
jgi:hypothetical protein